MLAARVLIGITTSGDSGTRRAAGVSYGGWSCVCAAQRHRLRLKEAHRGHDTVDVYSSSSPTCFLMPCLDVSFPQQIRPVRPRSQGSGRLGFRREEVPVPGFIGNPGRLILDDSGSQCVWTGRDSVPADVHFGGGDHAREGSKYGAPVCAGGGDRAHVAP